VLSAKTSKVVWDYMQKKFSSSSRARTIQIRVELATAKKRTSSAEEYIRKIISSASKLAAIDAPHVMMR
jgi:hypothetical protein